MYEKPSHMFGGSEEGTTGSTDSDLVRSLLLALPTNRNKSMSSCSAPNYGTLVYHEDDNDVPMQAVEFHRTLSASPSAAGLRKPPSSLMPLQHRPPMGNSLWNRRIVEDQSYQQIASSSNGRNDTLVQNQTIPTAVRLDPATRQQINEFEDMIEKIDMLNSAPVGGSLVKEKPQETACMTSHLPPKYTPFDHHHPPQIQRTSWSSVDNDLEILLQQNPSLLDPLIDRGGSYDCDSGIDVSPASQPFASLKAALLSTDHGARVIGGHSNVMEMAKAATPSPAPVTLGALMTSVQLTDPQTQCMLNKSVLLGVDALSVDRTRHCPQTGNPGTQKPLCYHDLTSPAPLRHNIGPPPSLKSATMTTRTNLKQILQMQQVQDEERKEHEKAKMTTMAQGGPPNTVAVTVPMNTILPPRVDVPSEVLVVKPLLENPTRYHVLENKKRQLHEYLTTQSTGRSILAQSVPNDAIGLTAANGSLAASVTAGIPNQQHLSSSAPSPDSPNSVALSSSAASEEPIVLQADVIDTIIQMESSMDTENHNFLQTSTVPANTTFLEALKYPAASPTSAKSCPSAVTVKQEYVTLAADPQLQALAKDRQKKDNHNMIERRRRYKINDHIKELATLLPKSSDPFYDVVRTDRQNKGNILKASVDFIRELKKEVEHLRIESNDAKKLQQENWKLRLQNQQLLNVHAESSNSGSGSPDVYMLSRTAEVPAKVKREPPEQQSHHLSEVALDDFMEDDQHPVNGDPMLPSPMGNDNILLSDEMDFIS